MYQNSVVDNTSDALKTGVPGSSTASTGRAATDNAEPYCDYQYNEMTKATTKFTNVTQASSTAKNQFHGHTKCTYQFVMADHEAAPTIKITVAFARAYHVHWMDFDTGSLGTNNQLGSGTTDIIDASDYKFGVYKRASDAVAATYGASKTSFFNPIRSIEA